jgi:hypothetical protein
LSWLVSFSFDLPSVFQGFSNFVAFKFGLGLVALGSTGFLADLGSTSFLADFDGVFLSLSSLLAASGLPLMLSTKIGLK